MRTANRVPIALSLATAAFGVLMAVASIAPALAAGHAVAIHDTSFGPKTISIRVGDRITWTNKGSNPHNVTFDTFASDTYMDPGTSFGHTFKSAGTFSYTCTLHGFSGTVTVTGARTPKPSPKPAPKPTPRPSAAVGPTTVPAAASSPPSPVPSVAVVATPVATPSPAGTAPPSGPAAVAAGSSPPSGVAASGGGSTSSGQPGPPVAILVVLVAVAVGAVGAAVARRR